MTVQLRLATIDDLDDLLAWDRDPDVAFSGGDDDSYDWAFEINRSVNWQEILIATENQRPIGVVVVLNAAQEESHYWGTDVAADTWAIDIWIGSNADRSKGFGTQMIEAALDRCFNQHQAITVVIDPLIVNEKAIRFYRRIGFHEVGMRRFGDDDCLVMKITRTEHQDRIENRQNDGEKSAQ
ncbi:MAG: hypothetical protein RLZZ31_855 [Actinomycetota bacterium]